MTKQFWMALPLATAVAMAGCTTTDPYSGETQRANATTGAGIGAAVGAVAGALSGDGSSSRRDRALIGAAVGAAAGSGIGYYMDRQEAQLRERLPPRHVGAQLLDLSAHLAAQRVFAVAVLHLLLLQHVQKPLNQ